MPKQARNDLSVQGPTADALLFAVQLRPHRSLSLGRRRLTLAAFAMLQGGGGLAACLFGAWPVAFFFGLTWLGLVAAFRRNAADAQAYEEIALSALELHYARVNTAGARREWRFNPLWVRLAIERHAEFGVERLDFYAREKRVQVGAFLGRGEKTRLAAELAAALAAARRGARF